MKKIWSFILAVVMAFSVAVTAYGEYKEGEYTVPGSLPLGEYVIFAEEGKTGKYILYDKANDEMMQGESFDYCTIVKINRECTVILENAYAVKSSEVGPLDITRNGVFRVGIDLPEGTITFKKDQNSEFAYVERFYAGTDYMLKNQVMDKDNDEFTIYLRPNSYIAKFNCDVYKGQKCIADYTLKADEISDYDMSKVSARLKEAVSDDLMNTSLESCVERNNEYYAEKIYNKWIELSESECDKKYAEINYEALKNIEGYYKLYYKIKDFETVENTSGSKQVSNRPSNTTDEYENGEITLSSVYSDQNTIVKGLSNDVKALIKSSSFSELSKNAEKTVAYLSEITIDINHYAPDFRYEY